ncbi:MAG: ABC transporter permease [Parachlamydiales bacterium]|nr:ABC transporter permease [Parachlamydiales bacterium]
MQKILSDQLEQAINKGKRRRLRAILIKEFFQIIRDPSTLLISVFLPLLLLFLYGYGVSLDLDHLRIGLVLEDTAPDARSFCQALTDSHYFDVDIVRDTREVLEKLESGHIRGFVVVPSYFSSFRYRNSKIAPIQVIADGSEPNTANFVQNYVQGAFQNWLLQEKFLRNVQNLSLINIDSRVWYNEQLESRYFLLSGSLAIIMTLIGTLLTALVVAKEWERGTMESMMATSTTILEIILGKILPYFVLGMVSMVICVAVSVFFYGLPLRGSIVLLGLVSAIFLFCALGIGLLISTFSRDQFFASQIALIAAFLPSYILSGFLFEISSMPLIIQYLTYLIPAKYFVTCLQTLFLVGNVGKLVFINVLPMIALGFVFFLIARLKIVKRLD